MTGEILPPAASPDGPSRRRRSAAPQDEGSGGALAPFEAVLRDAAGIAGVASVDDAAKYVGVAWRRGVESIIETGRRLCEVRAYFDTHHPGAFGALIGRGDAPALLPFGKTHAYRLMAIAEQADRLVPHVGQLPADSFTLHELVKLDPAALEERFADGTIRADMQRRDITQAVKRDRRDARESELAAKTRALPDKRYNVIYADPEWAFEPYSRQTGMDRAADNHYPTSPLEAIKARAVGDIAADDCVLFLWATAPMLAQAMEVMTAWGFAYKSHQIWRKQRKGDGRGTGYWFINEHELLLVGTKGNIPAPTPGTQMPSVHTATVGRHSEKPDDFAQMIELYYPNLPKIELNARRPRDGWDVWGNEADLEKSHDDTRQRLGRPDGEQRCAASVSPAQRDGEGGYGGPEGRGSGVSDPDPRDRDQGEQADGPRNGVGADQDRRSGDVGGEGRYEIANGGPSRRRGSAAPQDEGGADGLSASAQDEGGAGGDDAAAQDEGGDLNAVIRARYAANVALRDIAAETGLGVNAIKQRAKRMGLGDRARQIAAVSRPRGKSGAAGDTNIETETED